MLTILFYAAVIWVTLKLLALGVKAAWGLAKVFITVLLFPLIVIGLFLVGLIYVAIFILIIAGLISLLSNTVFD